MATEVLIRGVAALGVVRLRELAANAGVDPNSDDARRLATRLIESLERPEELGHRGLTEADVEAIGQAIGLGARGAWRPRISAEAFERLPFYEKPSYDQDVWAALLSPSPPAKAGKPRATERPKAKAKPVRAKKAKAAPVKAKAARTNKAKPRSKRGR